MKALGGKMPIHALTGAKPDLLKLRQFGYRRWVLRSDLKLDGQVAEARWIRFNSQTADSHRIYWPGKHSVSVKRNVTFDPSTPVTTPNVSDKRPPADIVLD